MSDNPQSSNVLYKDSHFALIDVKTDSCGSKTKFFSLTQPSFLSRTLQDLVSSSILCDLSISNGQTNYKIHKVVLTALSPQYAKAFLEPSSASPSDVITLVNVSNDALEAVLQYMYTGEIVFSDSLLEDILSTTIQLDLTKLMQICVSFMQNYNVRNIFRYISIADKHQQIAARQKMIKFARKYLAVLESMPEFLHLPIETLTALLDGDTEGDARESDSKLHLLIRWLDASDQQKAHAQSLLGTIDLTRVAPQVIRDQVEGRQDLFPPKDNVDSLLRAYKYHALQLANQE